MPVTPEFFSITLGQIITGLAPVLAILWGVARMTARTDEFFHTLRRHEERLNSHDVRLNEHGERIATVAADRRR